METSVNAIRKDQVRPGRIFSVRFVKKDGTVRFMKCRTGVSKFKAGGELAYNPEDRNLKLVYDIMRNGYRMVNVNTVYELVIGGKRYLNHKAQELIKQL